MVLIASQQTYVTRRKDQRHIVDGRVIKVLTFSVQRDSILLKFCVAAMMMMTNVCTHWDLIHIEKAHYLPADLHSRELNSLISSSTR